MKAKVRVNVSLEKVAAAAHQAGTSLGPIKGRVG